MRTEPETIAPSAALPERLECGSPMWTAALVAEIALGDRAVEEVCGRYGIDEAAWAKIKRDEAFTALVREMRQALINEGVSFRLKARVMAERNLPQMQRMIDDAAVPASVRTDLLKFIVKAAGLDASTEHKAAASVGNALQIIIHLD